MKFSEKIKNLRLSYKLTQQQLSEHLGITASAIGFLENGQREPTGRTLVAYAKYFNVSIDMLVGLNVDDEKIFTPDIPAPTLPTVERELLTDFRKLPDELRHRASKYMKKLVELYEEESAPKMDALPKKKNTGHFPA